MASRIEIMMCAKCGIPMNCHAEKPVEPCDADETRAWERGEGPVEQIHTCPSCGAIDSRRLWG
jgi:transcription elongation factor Elf1